jgi:exonuclease III
MHKDNHLRINTINCQGLGDCNKRRDMFNYLRNKKFNIYFLQDTHFISDDENFIQAQWGYKAYFSSFKSNSRGVAVLLNNNFDFCITNELNDENGNYIILECTIEEHKFILVSIYGPNSDSPNFYSNLLSKINEIYDEQHIIIAGDFNMIMNKEL